jgi:transcriptional regulator NrdR family protein
MKTRRESDQAKGICCPQCGCRHFDTTHTEPLRNGRIRRRKVCRHCGRRLVTLETPLGYPLASESEREIK